MSVCSGLNALFSSQKKPHQSACIRRVGGAVGGWGVEPLLESTRSLHHLVLVGRCPEQLDSGVSERPSACAGAGRRQASPEQNVGGQSEL